MMESFLDGKVQLFCGDCREQLKILADNSVDAGVMDPPYALVSIVKRFSETSADDQNKTGRRSKAGADGYARLARGFMGQDWDTGETAFAMEFWQEVLRVLKPGAHLFAFSGTRTYHRMACAIEDAGFEIRDQLGWVYGSGFPKSHDVSKGIDKRGPNRDRIAFPAFAKHYAERRKECGLTHAQVCDLGGFYGAVNHGGTSVNWERGYALPTVAQWEIVAPRLGLDEQWKILVAREEYEREVIGTRKVSRGVAFTSEGADELNITAPGSEAARQWQGWGTALKPAWEPIVLARKPLSEKSVAANVLRWGTGALNIDGCRIKLADGESPYSYANGRGGEGWHGRESLSANLDAPLSGNSLGRFPANLIHDGSAEVLAAFPDAGGQQARSISGGGGMEPRGDEGSAARFFYSAKADGDDRLGSKHPTVKPVDLMQWLCRLITPPGGVVLDAFAGTGTTGEAAFREGFRAVLIERSPKFQDDIRKRMALALRGSAARKRAARKKSKIPPIGGMFGDE